MAYSKYFSAAVVAVSLFFVVTVFVMSDAGASALAETKGIFDRKCAKCHGLKGKVTKRGRSLGAKNFSDPAWQRDISDEEIINVISDGKKKMPGWKGKLSADEIKRLTHYVRVLLPRSQRSNMPRDIKDAHYAR